MASYFLLIVLSIPFFVHRFLIAPNIFPALVSIRIKSRPDVRGRDGFNKIRAAPKNFGADQRGNSSKPFSKPGMDKHRLVKKSRIFKTT
jgi:hypothetical protein